MAVEIGFKKWSRGWTCGLPTDSPLALFLGLLKTVRVCTNWTKSSMCCVLELLK